MNSISIAKGTQHITAHGIPTRATIAVAQGRLPLAEKERNMRTLKRTSEAVQIRLGAVSWKMTSMSGTGKSEINRGDERKKTSNKGMSHPETMATNEKRRRARDPARVAPSEEGGWEG
jgi:hypothetical protein